MIPNAGSGGDFNLAFLFTIPFLDGEALPSGAFIFGNFFQSRQAFPFLARPSHGTWCILDRLIQGSIHAKAHDGSHRIFQLAQPKKELNHGKTTIPDDHQLPLGQPTASLKNHLPGPLGELLVLARFALVVPFGRCQYSQEWQSPGATRPGNRGEQHQAQPTQTTRLDKVAMARTNRIPIDSFGFDLGSPSPFDRVVEAQDHRTADRKGLDQQSPQNPARFQARPSRTIQNTMVIREMLFHAQPRHAQCRGHRSFGGRKDCPDQQDLRMLPNPLREQARKGSKDYDIFALQGRHRPPLVREIA